MVLASRRSISRIFFADSIPFKTGILISIKMASYQPGTVFSKDDTPSAPFTAVSHRIPVCSSSITAISLLISLSSTSSTLLLRRESSLSVSLCRVSPSFLTFCFLSEIFIGIFTVKTVPLPGSLSALMVPFSSSTSFLLIESPSPVPSNIRLPPKSCCSKGSNILAINSSDIPIPVSLIINHMSCSPASTFILRIASFKFISLLAIFIFPLSIFDMSRMSLISDSKKADDISIFSRQLSSFA